MDCTYIFNEKQMFGLPRPCDEGPLGESHKPSEHTSCRAGGPKSAMYQSCMYHPYQPKEGSVDSIDITPSDEGYVAIAETFIASIMSDVPFGRMPAVAEQLKQVLTIVGYLAQHGRPDLAKRIIDRVQS